LLHPFSAKMASAPEVYVPAIYPADVDTQLMDAAKVSRPTHSVGFHCVNERLTFSYFGCTRLPYI
jgi:hypothetical protein